MNYLVRSDGKARTAWNGMDDSGQSARLMTLAVTADIRKSLGIITAATLPLSRGGVLLSVENLKKCGCCGILYVSFDIIEVICHDHSTAVIFA